MREYWEGLARERGVVHATGADGLGLDDVVQWFAGTGFAIQGRHLDIGCGSGRLADLSPDYVGCDIAPAMVEYARKQGRTATLIDGPDDLPVGPFDCVTCLSVFTHIDRPQRQDYLLAIRDVVKQHGEVLVDIIPGERDGGTWGLTVANSAAFATDIATARFEVRRTLDWVARDGTTHRYYRLLAV